MIVTFALTARGRRCRMGYQYNNTISFPPSFLKNIFAYFLIFSLLFLPYWSQSIKHTMYLLLIRVFYFENLILPGMQINDKFSIKSSSTLMTNGVAIYDLLNYRSHIHRWDYPSFASRSSIL